MKRRDFLRSAGVVSAGLALPKVTRLFAEFKKKQLLRIAGSTLIIRNKAGLEVLVGN